MPSQPSLKGGKIVQHLLQNSCSNSVLKLWPKENTPSMWGLLLISSDYTTLAPIVSSQTNFSHPGWSQITTWACQQYSESSQLLWSMCDIINAKSDAVLVWEELWEWQRASSSISSGFILASQCSMFFILTRGLVNVDVRLGSSPPSSVLSRVVCAPQRHQDIDYRKNHWVVWAVQWF